MRLAILLLKIQQQRRVEASHPGKGDHYVQTRPARSVEDEGGRQPLREWPSTPSLEMQALRYGQTTAASFSPSRHAILVKGRPCVVPCVILSCFGCWLFFFVKLCMDLQTSH